MLSPNKSDPMNYLLKAKRRRFFRVYLRPQLGKQPPKNLADVSVTEATLTSKHV
jgi:hypothetical protein